MTTVAIVEDNATIRAGLEGRVSSLLTRRERESLDCLAQGFTNKAIAEKLSLSAETVSWHLRQIYKKLHVHSRTEAAIKFLEGKRP